MTARLGIVGLGRLAEVGYLPAARLVEQVELVGVADVRPERCARLAPGVPGFESAAELVVASEVDLVVIATPPASHLGDARAVASAGVQSLVEKPAAPTLSGADALDALVPRPWLGRDRRFDPAVERLRQSVTAFEPPIELQLSMSIRPKAWGAVVPAAEPLLDLGPHVVDLATWLSGRRPVAVSAGRLGEHDARFELELDGGRAQIEVSHGRAWKESIRARSADGRQATLVRGGPTGRVIGRLRHRGGLSPLVATLAAQLEAVAVAVRGGGIDSRLATSRDGVMAIGVLDAATASAASDGARIVLRTQVVAPCSP